MSPSKRPPVSIRLPREVALEVEEEMAATGRSRGSILAEAYRVRAAVLAALGIAIIDTHPDDLPEVVARHITAGAKALGTATRPRLKR